MTNLVIIPAGKTSEHQKWNEDHKNCGFDLCVLNYTNDYEFVDRNSRSSRFHVKGEGMKWKLISDFLATHAEWEEYDYILFMDDDIETTPTQIEKFFNICSREEFDLCQPALCEGSTFTFMPTKKIPNAKYHLTNMAEVMTPCMSKRFLKETVEDIRESIPGFGWGLEGVWNTRFHAGNGKSVFGGKIGVIDDVEFCHNRPSGGTESKIYEKFGSPWEELARQEKRIGFKWATMPFVTYSVRWNTDE